MSIDRKDSCDDHPEGSQTTVVPDAPTSPTGYKSARRSEDLLFLTPQQSLHLWCVIETLRGDPILSIWASESFCLIGTLLGRVVAFTFNPPLDRSYSVPISRTPSTKVTPSSSFSCLHPFHRSSSNPIHVRPETSAPLPRPRRKSSTLLLCGSRIRHDIDNDRRPPPGSLHLVAAYSDEGVRAICADDRDIHAVIGNSRCRTWSRTDFSSQTTTRLDRRISGALKHVLQYGTKVLIPSTGVTVVVDMTTQTNQMCPFRLPDKEIVPCDFNGTHMLVFTHHADDIGALKVLKMPASPGEPRWGSVTECVFNHNMPKAKIVTHVRFWGDDKIVYTNKGREIHVYSWRTGALLLQLSGPHQDVVGIDVSDPKRLIAIDRQGLLLIWEGTTGSLSKSIKLDDISFDSGLTSQLYSLNCRWLFFTSDQGLFLLDLGFPVT